MIKVTIQGNTTPDDREFVIIAGGKCLFRGELSPELQASDVWVEIGKLLRDYQSEEPQMNVNQQMAAQWINQREMYRY
jgi:hypothetical protein